MKATKSSNIQLVETSESAIQQRQVGLQAIVETLSKTKMGTEKALVMIKDQFGRLSVEELGFCIEALECVVTKEDNDHIKKQKNKIRSSSRIQNNDDIKQTIFMNIENRRVHKIDDRVAAEILGKEYRSYVQEKTIYADFEYEPHRQKLIFEVNNETLGYNQYIPPKWKEDFHYNETKIDDCDIPPKIERFLKHLVNECDKSYNYILDWIATSLMDRNLTILTCIGEQGIGKGVLSLILRELHGHSNFLKTSDTIFKEKFNGAVDKKTLVFVDEISLKNKEQVNKIKDVINSTVTIEKKGVDATEEKNHASYYLASNYDDALMIEEGDRRFSIIELTETKLTDSSRKEILEDVEKNRLIDEMLITEFANFLFNRVVKNNMKVPFRSSKRALEIRLSSLKEWQKTLLLDFDYISNDINVNEEYSLKELKEKLDDIWQITTPGLNKLSKFMKDWPDFFSVKQPSPGKYVFKFLGRNHINLEELDRKDEDGYDWL